MKTKKVIFPVVVFTFMILLLSCSKEDEADSYDYIENAGIIHNQLLDNYYQNRSNISPDIEDLISEVITLSSDYLISEGYDDETVLDTKLLLKEKYKASNLKSVMGSDFSIDIVKLSTNSMI